MEDVLNDSDVSEIENEIENWCLSLTHVEMDIWLEDFQLLTSRSRCARADRLFRRLCGDYTAADFARTNLTEGEIEESLNHIEVRAAIESAALSEQTQSYRTHRRYRNNTRRTELSNESDLAVPLSDSSNMEIPQSNAFVFNYFTANGASNFTNELPITSVGVPTVITSIQVTTANNAPTTVTSSGQRTITSVAPSLPSRSMEHTVRCTFPDGSYHDVQRELALKIIELQQSAEYLRTIVDQRAPDTTNYSVLHRELMSDAQNRASSTRVAPTTSVSRENTLSRGTQPVTTQRRSVNFQDTYDLQLIPPDESTSAPSARNTNTATDTRPILSNILPQVPIHTGTIPRISQPAEPSRPVRSASGRGVGTLVRMIRPQVSAHPICPRSLCNNSSGTSGE